jgi:hypothetical protein
VSQLKNIKIKATPQLLERFLRRGNPYIKNKGTATPFKKGE